MQAHVSIEKGKDDPNASKYSVSFSFSGNGSVRATASPRIAAAVTS